MPGSQPAGTQLGAQPQAQPPSVAAAPYGSFPALPTVPEPKVGISARPARTIQTTGTSHASPLLSLRGTAGPKLGVQLACLFARRSSQREVLADFTREATPEEDGSSAAVREALPTLGRLASEGYTYEPSPTQLVAMHTLDPKSLHKLHNFTVTRAGIGSIRWLRPVDVVGLKLDDIVTIQQGEVFCYSDVEKPPLGQGLNLEAEITLYGVHKVDRTTGAPVRDGPQLVKWEKSLRLMCLRMGAKFVAYKPDGGVWRFEVEHFSRYGLLPEVEAEVEDPGAAGTSGPDVAGPGFGGTPASRTLHPSIARTPWGADRQPRFGTMMGMEDDDEEEVSLVPHGADACQADQGLNLSPASLLALRDSFGTGSSSNFGGGGRGALSPPIEAQLGLLPNKRAKPTLLTQPLAAPRAPEITAVGRDGVLPGGREAAVPAAYAASTAAGERAPIAHSWRRAAAPLARPLHLSPSTPAPPTTLDHQGVLVHVGGGVDGGTADGGGGRLAARAMGVMLDEEEEEVDGVGMGGAGQGVAAAGGPGWADSGLTMARSFRASWGPGGILVVPGRGIITGSSSSHPISLLHVSPCAPAAPPTQNAPPPPLSRPDPLGLIEHAGAEPGSQATTGMEEGEASAVRDSAQEDLRQRKHVLRWPRKNVLSMQAHAGLSKGRSEDVPRWQLRCTREILKDFVGALTAALRRTLILPFGELSEQQQQEQQQQQPSWLEAEAVRVAYDMDTWQLLQVLFARLDPSMAPGILSGAATAAAGSTQGPRTPSHARSTSQGDDDEMMEASAPAPLGMGDGAPRLNKSASAVIRATSGGSHSRSRSAGGSDGGGTPSHPDEASAPLLMAALRQGALSKWLQQQAAPRATTAIEKGVEGQGALEPALHAGEAAAEGAMGPRPVASQAPVSELLVASSHSAHPCDCALPWMLCTALQGLGVVRGGAQHTQGAGQGELSADAAELMLASHMDLILQVQQAGGMPEWAIYVAMHLPDSAPAWQAAGHKPGSHSLRWHVVRELLVRSAPEWAGDGTKEAFLCDTLGVPAALVAEAVAVRAQHQGDFHTACTALMAAGQWHQAHELLVLHVAPSLMLSKGYDRLETLLQDMAPRAPQLPDWHLGGGLYLHFLSTMSALPSQHHQHHHLQLTHLLDQLLQLSESLAAASAAVSMCAHTKLHLACVAVASAPGSGAGGGAHAGLSPHALQQRVVLGAMARRVKSALLHVAHRKAQSWGPCSRMWELQHGTRALP
ncbi:hypothetical protein DUNSADRAFT_14956 [Dunaliella salina]|uniref:Peptidase S59 domain-containing protein n=1 Tax=Dunaliella salina TaxID=3046 RepID=A0ABQ7G6E8_DUNSA|nr:hypothetical protein DUNSADRAFT_14956 [Dunaliella salina]|eukprot:KAF5830158.1 hypothetical protein DUNSADRAFT_14956 [Dunaliella salina]